jgi:folate-binding protein YgfZ
VALRDASAEFAAHAGWGGAPLPDGAIAAPDPRLPEAGWRALAAAPLPADATADEYDRHRLSLGLPDGAPDMEREKSVLLEGGFDELSGVSWTKGCYMGQELTARTKYRGLLKRRLFPVSIEGRAPPPGTPVTRDGAEVGEMRSARDGLGLALLRIEAAEAGASLRCAEATLTPRIPGWMRLPSRAPA